MSVTAVARRYAEALADVAIERGQAGQVQEELRGFAQLFSDNRELYETFSSPIVSQKDKQKILDSLVQLMRPSDTTTSLLKLLLRNYRLHHVKAVYEQFRKEMYRRGGVVPAEVTTAAPLSSEEQQLLARQLEQITGRRVDLQFRQDPSLIGGAVTRIGSVVYDGSIRTRLEAIRQNLKQEGTAS